MKAVSLSSLKKITVILVFLFTFTFCYPKDFNLNDYVSHSWSTDNGLPSNIITSITQDSHGYIYFGTYVGLVKFNGSNFSIINRNTSLSVPFISARVIFENHKKQFWIGSNDSGVSIMSEDRKVCNVLPALISNSIRSIIETKKGEMWVGTTNGITRYKNEKKIVNIPNPENNGIIDSNIVQLYCDSFDQIWCITSSGNVYVYDSKNKIFTLYTPSFIKDKKVSAMFQDSKNNLWFGLDNNSTVMVKSKDAALPTDENEYKTYIGNDGLIGGCDVTSFMEDNNNCIWIGTDRGIFIVDKDDKVHFYTQNNGLIHNAVSTIYRDRENNIWIGTDQGGVQKLTKSRFMSIPTKDTVNCILDDKTKLWIGTDSGLLCYHNETFVENNITKLCKSLRIRHLASTIDGKLLISTYSDLGQLIIINDNKAISLSEENGLLVNKVRVALELSNGNIAIGTTKGLNIFNPNDNTLSTYTTLNGLTNDFIMSLWEDSDEKLWIGTDGGGINIMQNDEIIKTISSEKDGLAGDVVFKISQDKNDTFWICTGTGLSRYDGETFFNYNISNGLGNDSIFQMLVDQFDRAWLISNGGISSVHMSQLESMASGNKSSLEMRHYNKSDGLFNNGVTSTSLSTIDRKGRLCFTMVGGVSFYDPKQVNLITPPPAVIEDIDTGKEIIPISEEKIIIPANNKRITINFTGLTYISLDRVYFRYQLVGFDTKPSKLTTLRHVSYTNLKPGKYTFYLRVVNSDGVWSTNTAQFSFIKKAYLYQNPLFIIFVILIIAFSIYIFFRLKFRIMEIKEKKLEKIIAEKTQALENAMHDTERLLLNILPEPIAIRLKHDNGIIADSFKDVSILFSDIIGFTKISAQHTPDVIVTALNDLFSRFDLRALAMGIEKIKTLGDAYIAVCGMPKEDPNHANRLLEFARGMIKDIEEYNKTATVKFSMRIGINSGEVTAGIIGKTKFIYDIWGDAVNVASRMENCGIANMITVSESTYNLTKDSNSYKEDFLEIKGKGKMRIFRTE